MTSLVHISVSHKRGVPSAAKSVSRGVSVRKLADGGYSIRFPITPDEEISSVVTQVVGPKAKETCKWVIPAYEDDDSQFYELRDVPRYLVAARAIGEGLVVVDVLRYPKVETVKEAMEKHAVRASADFQLQVRVESRVKD